MSSEAIPQVLDDALSAHIPSFTAGQLVRALLLVIAEDNSRPVNRNRDARAVLCVGCMDGVLKYNQQMAYAYPDPDNDVEQGMIARLRDTLAHPRPQHRQHHPQPAAAPAASTSVSGVSEPSDGTGLPPPYTPASSHSSVSSLPADLEHDIRAEIQERRERIPDYPRRMLHQATTPMEDTVIVDGHRRGRGRGSAQARARIHAAGAVAPSRANSPVGGTVSDLASFED